MSNFIKIAEVKEYETSDVIEGRTPISVSATGSPGEVKLTVTHDGDVFAQLTINHQFLPCGMNELQVTNGDNISIGQTTELTSLQSV